MENFRTEPKTPKISADPVKKALEDVKKAKELLRKKEKAAKIAAEKQKIADYDNLLKKYNSLRDSNSSLTIEVENLRGLREFLIKNQRSVYDLLPPIYK